MMPARKILLCLAAIVGAAASVQAASSEWHRVEGAEIRIVTAGPLDERGRLRGALEIRLEPGWKTYWRDPGDAGVPPSLNTGPGSQIEKIEIGFPAPERFDDGYSRWAGYDRSVSLPLIFDFSDTGAPAEIEVNAFLGVCSTICIPVQAMLALEPDAAASDPGYASRVAAAFAALPDEASEHFHARIVEVQEDALVIETVIPEGAEPVDLFVASTEGQSFGTPERIEGQALHFKMPVLDRWKREGMEPIHYTLVTTAGAVSGTLTLE